MAAEGLDAPTATRPADATVCQLLTQSGDALWLEGNLDAAQIQYERARNADPTRPEVHARLARLALEMGAREHGLVALDAWLQLRPDLAQDSEVALLRGRLERLGLRRHPNPADGSIPESMNPKERARSVVPPVPASKERRDLPSGSRSDLSTHEYESGGRSPETQDNPLIPVVGSRRDSDAPGLDRQAAKQAVLEAIAATQNQRWGEARALSREALRTLLPILRRDGPADESAWSAAATIAEILGNPYLSAAVIETLAPQPEDLSNTNALDHLPVPDALASLYRQTEVRQLIPAVRKDRNSFLSRVGRTANSLGMIFVAVPGTDIFMSVWETRVRDFNAFAMEAHHKAERGVWSIDSDGWKRRNHSWRDPGFSQTPDHPVCAVDWVDAMAFCDWLTRRERALGWIGTAEEYRLPTDAEWSAAAGNTRFPWGDSWPPPADAGNYFGADAITGREPGAWSSDLAADRFPRTSPVGSFPPNALGIFDLGGNVWEWCLDWYRHDLNSEAVRREFPALDDDAGGSKYRILRGASWTGGDPASLRIDYRRSATPDSRYTHRGFRCVLTSKPAPPITRLASGRTSHPPGSLRVARVSESGGPEAAPAVTDVAPPP